MENSVKSTGSIILLPQGIKFKKKEKKKNGEGEKKKIKGEKREIYIIYFVISCVIRLRNFC